LSAAIAPPTPGHIYHAYAAYAGLPDFPPRGENGKTGDIALPAPSELQISAAQKPKPDPKPPRQSRGSLNQIEPQRTPVFLTFSLRGAAVSGRRSVGGVYN